MCYTLFDEAHPDFPDYVRYGVYQREKAPTTGLEHYQGYVEFTTPKKLGGLKKWMPTAHFEPRKGSRDQARSYCMKEDTRVSDPVEYGSWTQGGQGTRNDVSSACATLKQHGLKRVAEEHPEVFVKYARGLRELSSMLEVISPMDDFTPSAWQKILLDEIKTPHRRRIYWVWSQEGNVGKSHITDYLIRNKGAIPLEGRMVDMAYAYNYERIVVFPQTRTQSNNMEHLYSFAEKLKDGHFMSTKYETKVKVFNPPEVVFFTNIPPPGTDTFSSDRLFVINAGPMLGGRPFM